MTISVSRIIKMFKCQCICNRQCVQAIETFYWRWPTQSAVGTFKDCFLKFSTWYGFIWSHCPYKNTHAQLNMVNITASYKKGHWNTLSTQWIMVLPYIIMNPPQINTCSPSWTPLPNPSLYHPSGSSQCTSPKHPVSCMEPGLATRFNFRFFKLFMKWIIFTLYVSVHKNT